MEQEQRGPRIFYDFIFMSTVDGSTPLHALTFSRSKQVAATAIVIKGVTDFKVHFIARFIEKTGVKRFINFSDNEPAILALKDAAARALPFVE